jgi:3-deoxy-D-manno-octulosonic acid (KDO) 8-phosphate synthase
MFKEAAAQWRLIRPTMLAWWLRRGLWLAAVPLGIAALFWEVHPDPDKALCDGPNQLALDAVPPLLEHPVELDRWAKSR